MFLPSLGCGDGLLAEAADAKPTLVPPISGDLPGYQPPQSCLGARQSGCDGSAKCAVVNEAWECVADGVKALDEACTEDRGQGDDCMAGLHCYQGSCHELCTYADLCSDRTNTCIAIPSEAKLLGICLASCDALLQDCPEAGDGDRQGCYLSSEGAVCAPVSRQPPLVPGIGCQFLNECAVGAGCVDIAGRSQCAAYCDYRNNANSADPHCSVDGVCRRLDDGDGLGICGL